MKNRILKKLHTLLAAFLCGVALFGFGGCTELLGSLEGALEEVGGIIKNEDATIDTSYSITRNEGGGSYYYERLTQKQQRFYKKIHIDMDKFFAGKRELKTYTMDGDTYNILGNYDGADFGLTEAQALQAFDAFYQDCPQYYAYDGVYMLYGDGVVSPVIAAEYAKKTKRDSVDKLIQDAVLALRNKILYGYTDYDAFTIIYDYVVSSTNYEYVNGQPSTNAHAGNIVGVMDGSSRTNSVCVGYTFAITYLCNVFGVECISVGNETLNHAWNMVKLDGRWYHVDATNNDGNGITYLSLCGEKVFWEFFEYSTPQYDKGEADSVGRVGILPDVPDTLGYEARLVFEAYGDGYSVTKAQEVQSVLRAPATYHGKPVVRWEATNVNGVEIIILPTSIKELSLSFDESTKLFYEGTSAQLEEVSVNIWNRLTYSKVEKYYYSEEAPNKVGNFWHYDEDGNPTVWEAA